MTSRRLGDARALLLAVSAMGVAISAWVLYTLGGSPDSGEPPLASAIPNRPGDGRTGHDDRVQVRLELEGAPRDAVQRGIEGDDSTLDESRSDRAEGPEQSVSFLDKYALLTHRELEDAFLDLWREYRAQRRQLFSSGQMNFVTKTATVESGERVSILGGEEPSSSLSSSTVRSVDSTDGAVEVQWLEPNPSVHGDFFALEAELKWLEEFVSQEGVLFDSGPGNFEGGDL